MFTVYSQQAFEKIKSLLTGLTGDAVFYGLINATSRLFSFLVFPIVARSLSVADFAIFDFLYVTVVLSLSVMTLGNESLLLRRLPVMQNKLNIKRLITQSIIVTGGGSFLISLAGYLIIYLLRDDPSSPTFFVLFWFLMSVPFVAIFTLCESICRILNLKRAYFTLVAASNCTLLTIVSFVALGFSHHLENFIYALSISWFLFGTLSLFLLRNNLYFFLSPRSIFSGFKYSLPLAFASFISGASPIVERSLISYKLSVVELGLYSFASKMSLIVSIFIAGIQLAVYPSIMRNLKRPNLSSYLNSIVSACAVTVGGLTVIVCVYREFLMKILTGDTYSTASDLSVYLILMAYTIFLSNLVGVGLIIQRKTNVKLMLQIISMILSFAVVVLFWDVVGLHEIILSFLLVRLLIFAVEWYLSSLSFKLNWCFTRITLTMAITFIFSTALLHSGQISFPISVACFVAYAIFTGVIVRWVKI